MQGYKFLSNERSPFAPKWEFFILEDDFQGCSEEYTNFIFSNKELFTNQKKIISEYYQTKKKQYQDISFNLLKYQNFDYFKNKIKKIHNNLYSERSENSPPVYAQLWANVLNPGEFSYSHSNCTSEWSYLSGHITISDNEVDLVYINPITTDEWRICNSSEKINIFPSWIHTLSLKNFNTSPIVYFEFNLILEEYLNYAGDCLNIKNLVQI